MGPPTSPRARADRLTIVLSGVALAATVVAFAASALSPASAALVQSAALAACFSACSMLGFRRAITDRANRASSVLISGAFGSWAIGFALWVDMEGHIVNTASVADVAFLGYYPLAIAGIVLRIRTRMPRRSTYVWTDGGVAVLGMATVGSVLLLRANDLSAALTALLYPTLDVVVVSLLCGGIVVHGGRCSRSIGYLAAGAGFIAFADINYVVGIVGGGYDVGSPFGGAWAVGAVLVVRSTYLATEEEPVLNRTRSSAAVPALFAFIALLVLAAPGSFHTATSLLAVSTAAVCLVRMLVTERDLSGLLLARHEARTDELTGLANRRHLNTALHEVVSLEDTPMCLMMMDLDRFKEVNDILGHETGDRVLQLIARRLEVLVPEGSLLARFGGDEFVWLLRGIAADEARTLAGRVLEVLREPFDLGLQVVDLDASIGLVEYPRDGLEGATLLRHADIAMYRAKSGRAGLLEYDASFDPVLTGEYQLSAEVRRVSFDGEFVLRYQPLVSLRGKTLAGAEALVRWQHPRLGLLAPDRFLEVLMRSGRGAELTEWVTEASLAAVAAWRSTHPDSFVAVNLCADDLTDPDLVRRLDAAVARHGLPRSALHLEVPETLASLDRMSANDAVVRLGTAGYVVALDDFGTGTSSLSQLRELGPNEVKVDKSFGMTAPRDATAATILRAAVDLGHALGMTVTVEGVDNLETLELLDSIGCDQAQGYLLAQPMRAEELAVWTWATHTPMGRDRGGLDHRVVADRRLGLTLGR